MIDIWDWVNENHVEIVSTSGKVYRGNVIEVCTAEEDDTDEDTLALWTGAKVVGFKPSEIKEIRHY